MIFQDYTDSIESSLQNYLVNSNLNTQSQLFEAILYMITGKSKRIRPLLVCITAEAHGIDFKKTLPLACAIEYIHTYSLIHDDLPMIDNDDFRRNQPSCHKQFGESTALLAGDTLQIFAIECLAKQLKKDFKAEAILNCIQALSHACGLNGMAQGQWLDLEMTNSNKVSLDTIQNIHHLKTTQLLHACVHCTCTLAPHSSKHVRLCQFASEFGALFQIIDDILDKTGTKKKLGKTPNKDSKDNKPSILRILTLEDAKKMAEKTYKEALSHLRYLDDLNTQEFSVLLDQIYSQID